MNVYIYEAEGLRSVETRSARQIEGKWLSAFFPEVYTLFGNAEIGCNFIETHSSAQKVTDVEWHDDREIFLFTEGVSRMYALERGMLTSQTFETGDMLIVEAGVRHYIGPSVTPSARCIVVVSANTNTYMASVQQ